MRRFFFAVTVLLLWGCSPKIVTGSSDLQNHKDSIVEIYIEKPVPVPVPADSATVEALLKCDEHGEVLLQSLNQAASRNSQLQFSLDSMGRLMAKFKAEPDTIWMAAAEKESVTSHTEESAEVQTVTEYVERELTKMQKSLMGIGITALLIAFAYIVMVVCRMLRR